MQGTTNQAELGWAQLQLRHHRHGDQTDDHLVEKVDQHRDRHRGRRRGCSSYLHQRRTRACYLGKVTSPESVAGGQTLIHEPMDQTCEARLAWTYNPAQRRVLRAPEAAYDGPLGTSDGLRTYDTIDLYNGATALISLLKVKRPSSGMSLEKALEQ